jgi:diguanylate cyclase (GGDEF)-like protein
MPLLAALKARLSTLRRGVRAPARHIAPCSITARLGLSFAVVTILAIAGNLILTRGRAIHFSAGSHEPLVVPVAAPIAPAVEPLTAAAPGTRTFRTTTETEYPPPLAATINPLLLSIERFERAAHARAGIDSPDTSEQFALAESDLTRTSADFRARAPSLLSGPSQFPESQYLTDGVALVTLADARRAMRSDYSARFAAMSLRTANSLHHAWRFFGRVLERQSLVQLRADLEALEWSVERMRFANYDEATMVSLVASEIAFKATLDHNERSLTRSEGAPWIARMREDFSHLVKLRVRAASLDSEWLTSAESFSQAEAALTRAILHEIAMPASTQTDIREELKAWPPSAPSAAIESALSSAQPVPALVRPQPASTPAQPALLLATSPPEPRHISQRALAWITTGVLGVLFAISMFTVRSISGPVRRMLTATARLGRGELDVKVPRGGIRELDTLAVAFNQMSDELSAARQVSAGYQQELETNATVRMQQLREFAEQDPLTHLPNRSQLFVLLNAAIERASAEQRWLGVFFLDIDNFKNINDSVGHEFGDRVLIAVAQRLAERATAFGFAARSGGDEFTIVYEDAPTVAAVRIAGEALLQAFREPLFLEDRQVSVSVSVGASMYPDHGQCAAELLNAADTALFHAKALGRSQLAVYTPALLAMATTKFATEQGLRGALEHGEFELHFQPEISLETLQVTLVEALLRWRLPDGHLAAPAEFLGVAEESGLIMEISEWVLRTGIATAARWHFGEWPEARIALNIAPRQLLDPCFVERILEIIQEFQLPVHCIELELTESVLQTGPATIATLHRLRAAGFAIALDDFGTGYSSLTSLERLPLTRIKLDRSLIASINTSERSAAIARAIISLCNDLQLEVTAEGVERPEQLAWLLGNRAMLVQGYLLARPMPGHEFLASRARIVRTMQDLVLSLSAQPGLAVHWMQKIAI